MSSGVGDIGKQVGFTGHLPVKVGAPAGSSFADTLKNYLEEVNSLQREASKAVEGTVTGTTDDMAGLVSAMEKSDVAFRTLLAIRQKLMTAYDELRNMPI